MKDEWISIQDAAALLGVSDESARKMAQRGVIVSKRLHSRAIQVSRKSVEKEVKDYERNGHLAAGRPRTKPQHEPEPMPQLKITTVKRHAANDDYITPTNAAEYSGFHRSHIYTLMGDGMLTIHEIGGIKFLLKSDLDKLTRHPQGRPKKTG